MNGETKKTDEEKLSSSKQQNGTIQTAISEQQEACLNQDNDANRGEMIKNYEYAYDLKKHV